jgi:DNA helicase-2/ATP-dependent DNA helicase PcrA
MLVLTTSDKPQDYFSPIMDGLDQWPYVKQKALAAQKFLTKKQFVPKKTYSLSGINVYETCPQQFLFYNQLGFQPSRSAQLLFGNLVHYTIENVHNYMLDKKSYNIETEQIERWFSDNYRALLASGLRPINMLQKELALKQVFNYYKQNKDFFPKLQETEVDVSVEKENYILTGKIDLLLGNDGKLEILDFKTQQRPPTDSPTIKKYFNQLCLYAHILNERYGKKAERLYVYWTAEEKRNKALMEFSHSNADIDKIGEHFSTVIKEITSKNFGVTNPPDYVKVCKECDFRHYCGSNGVIRPQKLKIN